MVHGETGSIRFGAGELAYPDAGEPGFGEPGFGEPGFGEPGFGGGPVHRLRPLGPADAPIGFSLGGQTVVPPALASLLAADLPDRSGFNALKTCGLLAVLDDLWRPGPPVYGYRDALYDHLSTAWLRSAPGAVDPAAHLDRNFVDLLEIASRLRPLPSSTAGRPALRAS